MLRLMSFSLIWCGSLAFANADESGPVADYRMERVVDNQMDDASGHGNVVRVHGARPVVSDVGLALQFSGEEYVDCGQGASLELSKAATIEGWVRPEAIPSSEVTIAGKGPASYGLTFYRDGNVWWYISDGTTNLHTGLGLGVWTHVAGTYDGKTSRLYVDGREVASRPLDVPIRPGGPFLIGKGFQGAIGAVRIYDRALAADEIGKIVAAQQVQLQSEFHPVTNGESIHPAEQDYAVRVGENGSIQVDVDTDFYVIETALSYPGTKCRWHRLGGPSEADARDWIPAVSSTKDAIVVEAKGEQYSICRTVSEDGHRLIITDTLTNVTDSDVGVIYDLKISAPARFTQRLLGGMDQRGVRQTAENPSLFLSSDESQLGWLAEDDILRLQMDAATSINSARVTARRFALRPGESYTFRWALYPQTRQGDYWDFVNQVRRDWKVNTTVEGPFDYMDVTVNLDLLRDHERLSKYLRRKKLGVVALMPWVDYDNYNAATGRPTIREELKPLLQEAKASIQRVDPTIRCIGCIEGNLVSLPENLQKLIFETSPDKQQNQYSFTPEQMDLLEQYQLPWLDCLLRDRQGRCRYELYYRGKGSREIPMLAIAVYAALGNGQNRYWLDQAKWLMEDVGLDGLYIDQFNMAFHDAQRYSFDKWDGRTVDIDSETGEIVRRYTDAALVGIDARRSLADYITGRQGYMLANTFPATSLLQSAGIHRFNESEWGINLRDWVDGEMPPLASDPCKGHFSTPIALGFRTQQYGEWGPENHAKVINKGAISYLRHGLLYYHYSTEIPEDGPGAGEYGAINHMFPLTPVEIGPGMVIGKERIVTCVSGKYTWLNERKPQVLLFNIKGKPVDCQAEFEKSSTGWEVALKIRDWAEIAVVECSGLRP